MAPNGTVDLAFVNGRVATMDAARRWAGAVAVSQGQIVAVGTDGDVGELIGSETEVVDLAGRLLVPGFQDAHVHPPSSGLEMLRCNLSEAYDAREYERIVSEYASANPEEPWVVGGGWSMDIFPGGNPPKDVLDRVVPDRPVFLMSRDGHSAWVNSRALEIAGVTRDTPDPADGWIVRDAAGEPAGAVHEGAFVLRRAARPRGDAVGLGRRAPRRAAPPACARDHGVAGRDRRRQLPDPRGVPAGRRVRGAHRAGRGRAVVGPVPGDRAGPGPGRRAGAGPGRAVRGHDGQDHAGRRDRELHRRRPRALPGRRGPAHRQPGEVVRRGRGAEDGRHPTGRRGVPGAHPRDRGARGPGGARCVRVGSRGERLERPSPPHRTHPGRAPGRRPTLPRARRGRERPTVVGGERGADAPPHGPVPGPGTLVLAVPVREPRAFGGGARDGERLVGLEREPAVGDARRRESHRPGRVRVRRRDRRAVPAPRTHRPADRARRVHDQQRVREPPGPPHRLDRGRETG